MQLRRTHGGNVFDVKDRQPFLIEAIHRIHRDAVAVGKLEALIDPGLRVGRQFRLIQLAGGQQDLPVAPIDHVTIDIDVVKVVVETDFLQLPVGIQ